MSVANFIPTVWSENLLRALDRSYIGVANCNRDFEGEIRHRGDRVKICGISSVNVFDYTKNTDFLSGAQTLSDTAATLVIDQAKAFNFQIDDIDRAQTNPKLMDAALRTAAAALADKADSLVYKCYDDAGETIEAPVYDSAECMKYFISAVTVLLKNNVLDSKDIVFEVSPDVAELILKEKLLVNDYCTPVRAGCIGSILGCPLYVSNNICVDDDAGDYLAHHYCFARTRRAIAFAEQLSEIDAYRPEKRFADAVKGLHLYGAAVVYPQELVVLDFQLPTEEYYEYLSSLEDEDDEDGEDEE